jgi:hypothetical protein
MSTRTSSAILLGVLLAGCGGPKLPDKVADARLQANRQAAADVEGRVPCAPAGGTFAADCAIDRVQTQDGLFLTLRHPDGGFRRLRVTQDGRGVVAADGAERAVVTPIGADSIEVALGSMRYRLPATVRQPKAAR